MENIKRRKIENNEMDNSNKIIENQEEIISYIFQIGKLCENTFNILGNIDNKLNILNEKIENIELKNNYLENSINKINHTFIQELKNKDLEINSLKELNKNIIEDYHKMVEINSNIPKKNETNSFYL